MPAMLLPEILDEINSYEDEDARMAVLKKYKYNAALPAVLKCIYDPNIVWYRSDFPEYKPNNFPIGLAPSNLYYELRRFYLFMRKYGDHIPDKKKDDLLIGILESLHEREVDIVRQMFKKKSDIPWITEDFVRQNWPNLLPEKKENEKPVRKTATF